MYTSILVPHKEIKTNLSQVKETRSFQLGPTSQKIIEKFTEYEEHEVEQKSAQISAILIFL